MKRLFLIIVPCILAACTPTSPRQSNANSTGMAFQRTKLLQLTSEVETITAGYPANDATTTAIMATKFAGGTAAAGTMTAMPSETPLPTIPPDSPFCRPADLKTSFQSMGATQSILLGAGLTNISNSPCFLQAWPQVSLVDQQGQPIDVDYTYFEMGHTEAAAAATEQASEANTARMGVWPGWTAWLNLIWMNWCGSPIAGGAVIHLKLWEGAGIINIPTGMEVGGTCNAPEYRSTISIAKFPPALPPQ